MDITIDESIKQVMPDCRLGVIVVEGVNIRGTHPSLTREFLQLQAEVCEMYNLDVLKSIPRIVSVRSMYKQLAFDPARYRPASEALIRRVLQNKGLYYVNSAVDVNNYCSIKFLLPFGMYDLGNIKGDMVYKIAPHGDYVNIAGNTVSTDGKPFLTDSAGPFGNPTSDSKRAAVTLATKNILSVVYVDGEVCDNELKNILDFTAQMIVNYNNGGIIKKTIIYT